jgi:hypothetical protein
MASMHQPTINSPKSSAFKGDTPPVHTASTYPTLPKNLSCKARSNLSMLPLMYRKKSGFHYIRLFSAFDADLECSRQVHFKSERNFINGFNKKVTTKKQFFQNLKKTMQSIYYIPRALFAHALSRG